MTVLNKKNWDDEDISDAVEFILEKLNDGVQDLRYVGTDLFVIFWPYQCLSMA